MASGSEVMSQKKSGYPLVYLSRFYGTKYPKSKVNKIKQRNKMVIRTNCYRITLYVNKINLSLFYKKTKHLYKIRKSKIKK